jgi:hypothetical protein
MLSHFNRDRKKIYKTCHPKILAASKTDTQFSDPTRPCAGGYPAADRLQRCCRFRRCQKLFDLRFIF